MRGHAIVAVVTCNLVVRLVAVANRWEVINMIIGVLARHQVLSVRRQPSLLRYSAVELQASGVDGAQS